MSANVRYWRSVERDALKELEAAKTRTALNLAARQLMLARTKVLELTGEWIAQDQLVKILR
jgi:hypothetical protein